MLFFFSGITWLKARTAHSRSLLTECQLYLHRTARKKPFALLITVPLPIWLLFREGTVLLWWHYLKPQKKNMTKLPTLSFLHGRIWTRFVSLLSWEVNILFQPLGSCIPVRCHCTSFWVQRGLFFQCPRNVNTSVQISIDFQLGQKCLCSPTVCKHIPVARNKTLALHTCVLKGTISNYFRLKCSKTKPKTDQQNVRE